MVARKTKVVANIDCVYPFFGLQEVASGTAITKSQWTLGNGSKESGSSWVRSISRFSRPKGLDQTK
jgi:hypothetical protein